jgi:hypothetical protein
VPPELRRDEIVAAVRAAVEPREDVLAMWEAGSAAWGREDAYSDVDLQLLVEDDAVAATVAVVDRALAMLSPIDIRFEAPRPTWHGHEQVFYRLRRAGEYRLVDLAVMRRSAPHQLNERERHGNRRIAFDKTGAAATIDLDRAAHADRVAERLAQLSLSFPLFQGLARKEALRANPIGAIAFYYSHTLQPLLTLLRIRHCPERFDFGPRYAKLDLPSALLQRIEPLWFVASLDEITEKQASAERLFDEVLDELRAAGALREEGG